MGDHGPVARELNLVERGKVDSLSRFGAGWDDVVKEWCLGSRSNYSREQAWESLKTLERLWPDYVERIYLEQVRGALVIEIAIELGLALNACEELVGFLKLLARLKRDERGAIVELKVAAWLVRLGYRPELEPELNGKRLDSLVYVSGEPVYFEVIAPNEQAVIEEMDDALSRLARRIMAESCCRLINVRLNISPNPVVEEAVINATRNFPFNDQQVHIVPNIGTISTGGIPVTEETPEGPELVVEHQKFDGRSVRASCFITDARAQRLFDQKLRQFSRDHCNILVMDVSQIPDGITGWSPLIRRRFQPNLNRRIGAVVLLEEEAGLKIKWNRQVLPNEYAYKPPPGPVLDALGRP